MASVVAPGFLDEIARLIKIAEDFDVRGKPLTCFLYQLKITPEVDTAIADNHFDGIIDWPAGKTRLEPLTLIPAEQPQFVIVAEYEGPNELITLFRTYAEQAGSILRGLPYEFVSPCQISQDAYRAYNNENLWLLALRDCWINETEGPRPSGHSLVLYTKETRSKNVIECWDLSTEERLQRDDCLGIKDAFENPFVASRLLLACLSRCVQSALAVSDEGTLEKSNGDEQLPPPVATSSSGEVKLFGIDDPQPVATSPSGRVKLFAQDVRPVAIVDGKEKAKLTHPQYKVICGILTQSQNGRLTKDDMARLTGCGDAIGVFKRLREKDDWRDVLDLPPENEYGVGYGVL